MFLKLMRSADKPVMVNTDHIAYFYPYNDGTYIYFAAGKGESYMGVNVLESFEEISATLMARQASGL